MILEEMMFSVSETGKIEKLLSINITDLKEIHVVNNINSKTMLPEEMELSIEPTEQTSFDVQVEESVCKDENDLITESEELRATLEAMRSIHLQDRVTIDILRCQLKYAKSDIEDRDNLIIKLKARLYDLITEEKIK